MTTSPSPLLHREQRAEDEATASTEDPTSNSFGSFAHLLVKWGAFFAAKGSTYAASCAFEEAVSEISRESNDVLNPNDNIYRLIGTMAMLKVWGFAFAVTIFMSITVYELLGIARKVKSGHKLKQQLRMEVTAAAAPYTQSLSHPTQFTLRRLWIPLEMPSPFSPPNHGRQPLRPAFIRGSTLTVQY